MPPTPHPETSSIMPSPGDEYKQDHQFTEEGEVEEEDDEGEEEDDEDDEAESQDGGSPEEYRAAVNDLLDLINTLAGADLRVGKVIYRWRADFKAIMRGLYTLADDLPVPRFEDAGPSRLMVAAPPTPGTIADDAGSVRLNENSQAQPQPQPVVDEGVDDVDTPSGSAAVAAPTSPTSSPSATPSLDTSAPLIFVASDGSAADVFFDCNSASILPQSPDDTLGRSTSSINLPLTVHMYDESSDFSLDCETSPILPPIPPATFDPSASPIGPPVTDDSEMDFLYSHRDDSVPNSSFWGLPPTLQEFLAKPRVIRPTSSALAAKATGGRGPRAVELRVRNRMNHIVLVPDLGELAHDYIQSVSANHPARDLTKIRLTEKELQCLESGALLANCSPEVKCEADIEHIYKATQCHFVAETLNILQQREREHHKQQPPDRQDRIYPHKGTPGPGRGRSHAFADVQVDRLLCELKPSVTIDAEFTPKFLEVDSTQLARLLAELPPGAGLRFAFDPPTSFHATMGPSVQPVIQIWTQLQEMQYNFGQGSSHEFTFHAIMDPVIPDRLYMSRCYRTVFVSDPAAPIAEIPTESSLLTMVNLARIANNPEWSLGFLKELREHMSKDGNLVPVHSQNLALAGTFKEEWKTQVPTANVSKGTVGVKYYDQINSKQGVAVRRRKRKVRKCEQSSFADESAALAQVNRPIQGSGTSNPVIDDRDEQAPVGHDDSDLITDNDRVPASNGVPASVSTDLPTSVSNEDSASVINGDQAPAGHGESTALTKAKKSSRIPRLRDVGPPSVLKYLRPGAVPVASGSGTEAQPRPQAPGRPSLRPMTKAQRDAAKTSPARTRSRSRKVP
ncbi:hypothetical protein C8R47DRAFT_552366 [Mycena vitilis]|nr:hypothetical protein C8R47DRAFT_552366 [Mycena vitilis]